VRNLQAAQDLPRDVSFSRLLADIVEQTSVLTAAVTLDTVP